MESDPGNRKNRKAKGGYVQILAAEKRNETVVARAQTETRVPSTRVSSYSRSKVSSSLASS